jgi:hypothetical protein
MTSYLRYKQQIRTVQDADDAEIESWITVRGNHIPIKKGQSKEEAVKSFIESKGEKEKGGDYVSAGREKAKREAGHEFKKRSGVAIKFTEYDPEFEVVRKNALANGNVYGGKYTQKSKAEAYKEYKNDTSSKENMKKANEFVNGKPESSKKGTGSIIKQSKVEMTNGLKHITHTTPDGYKFSVWESSNDPGWKTNNLPTDYFETESEATEAATKQFKKDLEYYNSEKANKKGKQLFEEKYGTKKTESKPKSSSKTTFYKNVSGKQLWSPAWKGSGRKSGYTAIENQLLTEKEMEKHGFNKESSAFQKMELGKKDHHYMFGARFETKKGNK